MQNGRCTPLQVALNAAATRRRQRKAKEGRQFFFEKKNQKTFVYKNTLPPWRNPVIRRPSATKATASTERAPQRSNRALYGQFDLRSQPFLLQWRIGVPKINNVTMHTIVAPTLYEESMLCKTKLTTVALTLATLAPLTVYAGTVTTLYSFQGGNDGKSPVTGVIEHAGVLYGMTTEGGTAGLGTVFSVNTKTGVETVLFSFQDTNDESAAFSGMTYHNGALYGATPGGGAHAAGTLFAVDVSTGIESVLYNFTGTTDGLQPVDVSYRDGALYGTAGGGGTEGQGTLFKFLPTSGAFKVLHNFGTVQYDGDGPDVSPIKVTHAMYGVTYDGGQWSSGGVYKIDTKSGKTTSLHSFDSHSDGSSPTASLIYQGGFLYGTASCHIPACVDGNNHDQSFYGSVFRIDPATGATTVLHYFQDNGDGAFPYAGVTYSNGAIYGTTLRGTIYSINLSTGTFTNEYTFSNASVQSSLILKNGVFYGTTTTGGTASAGTVYKFVP
jgi:uncharacterized repeat protein (TIGR03803 family)